MMPQGDINKTVEFPTQKWLQRSPIVKGTISKNLCHKEFYLCGKFNTCIRNSTGLVLCCSTNSNKVHTNFSDLKCCKKRRENKINFQGAYLANG